jgi:hypothetical protein
MAFSFVPVTTESMEVAAETSLRMFSVSKDDGDVVVGRNAVTGITSKFCSRSHGVIHVDDDGVRYTCSAASGSFVSLPDGTVVAVKRGASVALPVGALRLRVCWRLVWKPS